MEQRSDFASCWTWRPAGVGQWIKRGHRRNPTNSVHGVHCATLPDNDLPTTNTYTLRRQQQQIQAQKRRQRGLNPRSTAYEAVALPLGHTASHDTNKKRHRRDLNSRGQSPLVFKTNSLTTRTRCLFKNTWKLNGLQRCFDFYQNSTSCVYQNSTSCGVRTHASFETGA